MKSRSHRLPITDTHDDWVDGSWTVDCVCGVNFDDGEEMVNCDECGVWVHTRCSRYVKTDKSFACDKCKSKNNINNNNNNNTRNDAEETEVAQLLVELPTKTLRMDNPYPSRVPSTRPYRLWTEIPIQERVHVQGVPGGDPALFAGLSSSSSIFTPRLWKSTGYVPKKFNFQYREFPCWDQEGQELVDKRNGEENDNTATADNENTAGVLFSLSKDNMSPTPLASSVVASSPAEDDKCAKMASPEQMNKLEAEDLDASLVQNAVKKDPNLPQPSVVNSAKRKKEESGPCKDRSERKRARIIEMGEDFNKKATLASRTAFTISSDEKQLEFYEDSGPMVVMSNTQTSKAGDSRDSTSADHLSNSPRIGENNDGNDKKDVAADGRGLETSLFDSTTCNGRPKENNYGYSVALKIENSPISNNGAASGSLPIKDEVVTDAYGSSNDNGGGSTRNIEIKLEKSELIIEDVAVAGLKMKDTRYINGSNGYIITTSSEPNAEVQPESDENRVVPNDEGLPLSEANLDTLKLLDQPLEISADNLSGHDKLNDAPISSLEASNHKVQEVDKSTTEGDDKKNKTDESAGDCQPKRESAGSLGARKISSAHTHSSKAFGETSKSCGATSLADPSQRKVVVSFGKSSSTTSASGMSKSSTSGSRTSSSIQIRSNSGQNGISDGDPGKNENASSDAVRDEESERSKKIAKELPKSSVSSASKTSQSAKFSHASVYRRSSSDSKDSALRSSSKASLAPSSPGSGVSASSLQTAGASNAENKASGSILSHTSEKSDQPAARHSSKVNTSHMQPPGSSNPLTTLSDEELALLLHQELNSSPRVPRVPRMRHAGSLPQLASPTATTMLMKRTSTSGGKDCNFTNRRKSKDSAKDGSHSSRDVGNESKKMDRVSPSPDHGGQDSACTIDPLTKKEVGSGLAKDAPVVKKNNPPASTTISSGLSSSTEVNEFKLSSTRNSPRNASDGDSGAVGRSTHLTLPGLIAEIMSKGKRMTYVELCNAVLPHWPHLRKHNGERYAYSSHSQAVLDCLRNRSEWARLVDRGPKTSASRKRRKVDPSGAESGDNGDSRERRGNDGGSKSLESQQEEFPKGKRQARKRRRLALKGRGVKDLRWRRRAKILSDDEIGSISNSSSGSLFSEDKIEGVGTSPDETEDSASSDETGS